MKFISKILFLLFVPYFLFAFEGKVLTPQEAFNVVISEDKEALHVSVEVGEQIYVYEDKVKIKLIKPKEVSLTNDLQMPKSEFFHETNVFRQNFSLTLPKSAIAKHIQGGEYSIEFKWQGCSEKGLCYQPMKKTATFMLEKSNTIQANEHTNEQTNNLSEQDSIAKNLANKSFFWIVVSFFGFGLLLSLTPCVFPMIPILSSIIVSNSDEKMNAKKGFLLSLVYVLAMSVAYTIAGILAGLFGANIQTAMQNPYVLFVFSAIFVALSFSMFGFYELQMPQFIQNIANKKSEDAKNKGFVGVGIMGFLSALIVGPCVAAPLAGALIYIGQSGDAVLGGVALFVMSLGMGVPLLLIGASAGKFLPKPGFWMDTIKSIFGVLMLGVAIWMIERVISSQISMLLWSFLIIGSAIYMGVFESIQNQNGWKKLLKTFSFILLLYGVLIFVGAFLNGQNILNPLANAQFTSSNIAQNKPTKEHLSVSTNEELDKLIQSSTKPIIVDFWASWCISCKELDNITFKDEMVLSELEKFTFVKIDVTNNTDNDQALLKRFNLFGPPGIIFYKDKKELKHLQIVGFKEPKEFLEHLKKVQM